jgi:glycosyltransferase involved in cell wall biosynthesis
VTAASAGPSALMIYSEPTSYIVDLVSAVRAIWPHLLDVRYLGANKSQQWDIPLTARDGQILGPGTLAPMRAVTKLIGSGKYRLVHLAGWGPPEMLVALAFARLRGIPTAVELDTHAVPQPPRLKRAAKAMLMPLLFHLPSHFLPGGQNQKKYLQTYGVDERRIRIAQMTVDVARISRYIGGQGADERRKVRKRLGLAADAFVFIYVGRLEPHKGVRDLLQAFENISADQPVQLAIVGDGTLKETVLQAERDVPGVRALGRLADDALLDAYFAADVAVLPSHFEPWGLVVNESMAAGLPVVVSDRVGCAADLIHSGETGLIFPAGHVEGLKNAMLRLMSDRPLRERMSINARRLISGWTLENEARIITSTWDALISR